MTYEHRNYTYRNELEGEWGIQRFCTQAEQWEMERQILGAANKGKKDNLVYKRKQKRSTENDRGHYIIPVLLQD